MYQVGEFIIYGDMGVCRVVDVSERETVGESGSRMFYTLISLQQECTIQTPVDNKKVFMRPVITREQAIELVDLIPSIHGKAYHNQKPSELTEHYNSSLKTYDCVDLVELAMSINAKKQDMTKQNRKVGAIDERFMKRAEELLFNELSVALGISRDEVPNYIAARVDMYPTDEAVQS